MEPTTPFRAQCLEYIEYVAERDGYQISLEPNPVNEADWLMLWDICMSVEAGDGTYTPHHAKEVCERLAYSSMLPVLQGVHHAEPDKETLEGYQKLFNTPMVSLNLCDTRYSKPRPVSVKIEWSIESDDEDVLKLQPGVQQKLW